jgi:hypothetical protein
MAVTRAKREVGLASLVYLVCLVCFHESTLPAVTRPACREAILYPARTWFSKQPPRMTHFPPQTMQIRPPLHSPLL